MVKYQKYNEKLEYRIIPKFIRKVHPKFIEYRATIHVHNISEQGFAILTVENVSDYIEKDKEENYLKHYLLESFIALKDNLHVHTHHSNPRAVRITDCPDNIVQPIYRDVISQIVIPKITRKESENIWKKYLQTISIHIEIISRLVHTSELNSIRQGCYSVLVL